MAHWFPVPPIGGRTLSAPAWLRLLTTVTAGPTNGPCNAGLRSLPARPGGTGQFSTPLVAAIDFGQSSGDNVRHGGRHLRRQSDTVTHVRGFDGEHHQPLGCPAERLA